VFDAIFKGYGMNWDDYRVFLALAEAGSLLKAGQELQVSHTTVLRRLNALEARLEVRLFERHKTGYVLTASGEKVLNSVSHLKDEIDQVERQVVGQDVRLSGEIRISTTDTIGFFWLPPFIKKFKKLYPDIVLNVEVDNRHKNLSKREADIVLPSMNRQPDYMVGRELAPIHIRLYAHRAYLAEKRKKKIKSVVDYKGFDFILLNENLSQLPMNQYVLNKIAPGSVAATASNFSGLYHLCLQGLGVAALPFYVGDQAPDLEVVGEIPFSIHSNSIWILTHPDLIRSARILAFMKFMREEKN